MTSPFIIANWKMHLSLPEVINFCEILSKSMLSDNIVIAPPLPYISLIATTHKTIRLASQDISTINGVGANTGEVSAHILKSCGVDYSIVGHSERRIQQMESDLMVKKKVQNAISSSITPIVCVGEPIDVRLRGTHIEYVTKQLQNSIPDNALPGQYIVAYEPVWAVGTGIIPTKKDIEEMSDAIMPIARYAPMIYGGSVNSKNVMEFAAIPNLHGVLVGNASLDAEELIKIQKSWLHKC